MARVGRATLVVGRDINYGSTFGITNAPATVGANYTLGGTPLSQMVPAWAVYSNGQFIAYANGRLEGIATSLRLDDANVPPTWVASWGGATTTLTRDVTVFALSNSSPGTVTGNFTVTIGNSTGQAGLTFGGGTIASAGLAFGGAEATIYVATTGGSIAANTTVTGTGGLTKFGPGTLTINGALNVSGPLTINGGKLAINGSVGGGGTLTVGNGQTLEGGGTIAVPVTIGPGGVLSPGNSPGTITVTAPLTMSPESVFEVELGGTGAGQSDHLALGSTGTAVLGGATLKVSLVNGYVPQAGDSITIISGSAANAVTGQFDALTQGQQVRVFSPGGTDFFAVVNYGTSSVVLNNFTPVPEPTATLAVAGLVLTAVGYVRRRKSA